MARNKIDFFYCLIFLVPGLLLYSINDVAAFTTTPRTTPTTKTAINFPNNHQISKIPISTSSLFVVEKDDIPKLSQDKKVFAAKPNDKNIIDLDSSATTKNDNYDDEKDSSEQSGTAATNTINERLMAELEEAAQREKFGPSTSMSKKLGLGRRRKTDEEIKASIEQARDLNGVNPIVALTGSVFALAAAAGLWYGTIFLGKWFGMHPVETDVYFVIRVTQVFRNVVIGMMSLASGFFGVTGLGIFLLGVRVAYGVITGELDPTPIKRNKEEAEEVEMPNVWDLMMNKKPGRGRK